MAAPATTGARDQVARLLTVVPYLHARGTVRLAEAADVLGVTPKQLLSDLKVLFMCGLPGGYPDDLIDVDIDALETAEGELLSDGVIRVSNADYLRRPLRLTATEASAVIVALRALRAGAGPDTVPIVDRVLGKLESAAAQGPGGLPVDAGTEADAATGPDEADRAVVRELADRLQQAVDGQVQVELDYYVPTRDEMSHRTVDPRGLARHGGHTYLDAWCHSAEAPRLFRLDRIARAEVLDDAVVTEPEAPRDLSEGLFSDEADTTVVTLRLAPHARWVVEYYPVHDVRPAADGTSGAVDVDLRVADERWLTKLLLRLAPNACVVGPPEYSEAFTRTAHDTLGLYSD